MLNKRGVPVTHVSHAVAGLDHLKAEMLMALTNNEVKMTAGIVISLILYSYSFLLCMV